MRIALLVAGLLAAAAVAASPLSAQARDRAAPEASAVPGNSAGGTGKAFVSGWNLRQCEFARYQFLSAKSSAVIAFNIDGSFISQTTTGTPTLGAGQATLLNICRAAAPYWVFCPTAACKWTAVDTGGL